jgi:ribosomal protein L7/L12
LQKGIRRVLISQFNPSDPGKGMEKLLNDSNNLLTLVKSIDVITVSYIIKKAKNRADELTASTGKTVLPSITSRAEAQEEADRLNVINQSVIGAKEGVIKAITKLVGSNVTNAILRTDNGSNHKSIDNFTLFEVMKLAIDGADQPSTNNVLEQLLEVINHSFNFRKKISINMEPMQSNAAQMAMYGIVIGIPQLTLTLLANIKTATKSNYGRECCSAMHAICKKYTYNHVHDATLLQFILKELAGTDGVRVLKDASTPGTGTVHSVAKSVSYSRQ